MARKPALSYESLSLDERAAEEEDEPVESRVQMLDRIAAKSQAKTLKEAASAVVVYLNPAAHKDLKRFAVEDGRRVHDLILEALEDWFKKHGLRSKLRADVKKTERES